MAVVAYQVTFAGEAPPSLGMLASMLEQGQVYDQYDAEFCVRETQSETTAAEWAAATGSKAA